MSNPAAAVETSSEGPSKQELRAQRKAAKASGKKEKPGKGAADSPAPSATTTKPPTAPQPASVQSSSTKNENSKPKNPNSNQQSQQQQQQPASQGRNFKGRPTTADSSSNLNVSQPPTQSNSVLTSLPSLFGNVSVTSLRTSPSDHLITGSSRRPKPSNKPFSTTSSTNTSSSSSISIHPSILSLAVQLSTLSLTGANARAIAVLGALSDFIRDYKVPKGNVLNRDLLTKMGPQITHLVEARPLGTSVGNAIRYLKYEISVTKMDWTEEEAKSHLQSRISHFIRDRIEFAGKVIHSNASTKIRDGDVVLTYGRSSVVEGTLLKAWENGRKFSVIVVDGRPGLEGKVLLKTLLSHGIPSIYGHLTALGSLIARANLVLLGTASLLANGALYARAGTASCAMMAHERRIPVVVCCETYKFSDRVQLDSFVVNEGADPLALLSSHQIQSDSTTQGEGEIERETKVPLSTSLLPSLSPSLSLVNLLYDLTPPNYVSAIASEVGLSGPESVGVILRDYKSVLYGV